MKSVGKGAATLRCYHLSTPYRALYSWAATAYIEDVVLPIRQTLVRRDWPCKHPSIARHGLTRRSSTYNSGRTAGNAV